MCIRDRNLAEGNKLLLVDCSLRKLRQPIGSLHELSFFIPEGVSMERIKGLKLSDQPIKQVRGVTLNIKILNLSGCKLKSSHELDKVCPSLKLLNVSDNLLSELPILKELRELYISNNKLTKFPSCPCVNLLDISRNPISSINTIKLPKLHTVSITDTPLSFVNNNEILLKKSFPNLKTINPADICLHSSYLNTREFWQSERKEAVKRNGVYVMASTFCNKEIMLMKERSKKTSNSITNLANGIKGNLCLIAVSYTHLTLPTICSV
eukprot:TRINITY_DN11227_c0_g1_i3.p1 TRINITY_DN11227_c0_g1~~TRINITY_DN11227_c0_g1_i3.p1  ORF type:complete len:266 (+),score=18.22 TRINITY_DN11227_c0_g1_i3:76-873(+)